VCVDALQGWEMQPMMRSVLCCLHRPLEGLAISSRAAAEPGSNAGREDTLHGALVKASESFCRHAKLPESPQKVKVYLL